MSDLHFMYDEREEADIRYVGFLGDSQRFDLMIIKSTHFYGKNVVACLQTNRLAILSEQDAANIPYLQKAFALESEPDAEKLSTFLLENL